jgi:hypothetical protein
MGGCNAKLIAPGIVKEKEGREIKTGWKRGPEMGKLG